MKILFISPTGTLDNGAEISTINLMNFLSQQGHTVHNVFPKQDNIVYDNYARKMAELNVTSHPLHFFQWWWSEAPGGNTDYPDITNIFYYKNIVDIRLIIRENAIDLVISNTVNVFQGAVAAACEGVRHFHFIHEFPLGEFEYYTSKIPFINEFSDKIFAVEGQLYTKLLDFFPKEKLDTFVPYSKIERSNTNVGEKVRLVSVGRITPNKNQLELLKAYSRLQPKDIDLVFIGGWDEDYKQLCDDFILNNQLVNVSFLGYQNNPWQFVQTTDICVFNSHVETFGLVLVEAALNGNVVIMSNNLGYQSVQSIFNVGIDYQLGNIDELVDKIKAVYNHFEHYKQVALETKDKLEVFYTLENAYTEFVAELSMLPACRPKPIQSVEGLLSLQNVDTLVGQFEEKHITVYFSCGEEPFSQENIMQYSLEKKGNVKINLPESCTKIRIDLSEQPSFYEKVRLSSCLSGVTVLPVSTNGIALGDAFIFPNNDPQLVYNIPHFFGNEFELKYQCYEMNDIYSNDHIAKTLSQELQQSKKKLKELESLRIQHYHQKRLIEKQQKEMDAIKHQYHLVVNSRRWKLVTKIINFFRRKK